MWADLPVAVEEERGEFAEPLPLVGREQLGLPLPQRVPVRLRLRLVLQRDLDGYELASGVALLLEPVGVRAVGGQVVRVVEDGTLEGLTHGSPLRYRYPTGTRSSTPPPNVS